MNAPSILFSSKLLASELKVTQRLWISARCRRLKRLTKPTQHT